MAKPDDTPQDVLTCDSCGRHINDLGLAMIFWWDKGEDDRKRVMVSKVLVAHKAPECAGPRDGERSHELSWYASRAAAAQNLVDLVVSYAFTAQQLERLIEVAWATPLIATAEQAERADFHAGTKIG